LLGVNAPDAMLALLEKLVVADRPVAGSVSAAHSSAGGPGC
jgi:hypothetical protein